MFYKWLVLIMRLLVCLFLFQMAVCQMTYEDIFNDILPKRLKPNVMMMASTRLYANRYTDIKDLVDELIGDPRYINNFDFTKPFEYGSSVQ